MINLLRPKTIEQLTLEDLYEARRHLLVAEANLEQASADVAKYRNRVQRLEASVMTWPEIDDSTRNLLVRAQAKHSARRFTGEGPTGFGGL
jgi:hypothetical protein